MRGCFIPSASKLRGAGCALGAIVAQCGFDLRTRRFAFDGGRRRRLGEKPQPVQIHAPGHQDVTQGPDSPNMGNAFALFQPFSSRGKITGPRYDEQADTATAGSVVADLESVPAGDLGCLGQVAYMKTRR